MKNTDMYIKKSDELLKTATEQTAISNMKTDPNWHQKYKTFYLKTLVLLDKSGFSILANELMKSSSKNDKPSEAYSNIADILRVFNEEYKNYEK